MEKIIKLIKSSVLEDIQLGMNFLGNKPLTEILKFFEKYGEKKYKLNFLSNYIIPIHPSKGIFMVVEREECLIWADSRELLLLNPTKHKAQIHYWKNITI